MKLPLALMAAFVCLFSTPSFARRRDCAQAIVSEEKFAFRELNRRPPAVIAAGPVQKFGAVEYQSVTVDNQPVLFFNTSADGLTIRWAGRGSVDKMRAFAERVVGETEPARVISKFSNETKGFELEHAGLPKLGTLLAQIARVEGQSFKAIGSKRHRSFGLSFALPGSTQTTEVAGSIMSRQPARGVRVKFAPELMRNPEFREAVGTLIDQTGDAWILWPNIAAALDAVAARI